MAGIDDEGEFAAYAAGALPRLRRIAYLLCQDWHRADDLTQSTLTSLYVHWRRAGAARNRDAYVGAMLMNAFLAEQRTAWWKRTSVRSEPAEALPAAATVMIDGPGAPVEELLDLRAALQTLAPRRRATIVLRYYCDYSIEQTAQLLGCSTGTVKSQTAKALTQLREVLEPGALPERPEGGDLGTGDLGTEDFGTEGSGTGGLGTAMAAASARPRAYRMGPSASGRTL